MINLTSKFPLTKNEHAALLVFFPGVCVNVANSTVNGMSGQVPEEISQVQLTNKKPGNTDQTHADNTMSQTYFALIARRIRIFF
jgi:hypothetical protein